MEYIACPRFCTSRGFRCFSRSAASSSPSSIINIALFCVPERWRGSAATASSLIACPLWRFAAQKLADDVGRARSVFRHEHADHGHLVVIAVGGGQKLRRKAAARTQLLADRRSEEHTSELQSLMRNTYAIFCLKKKNSTILKK